MADNKDNKSTPMAFGGQVLDRKKMEEERLARLKRRREETSDEHIDKKPKADVKPIAIEDIQEKPTPNGPRFLNGTLRRTAARGHPRQPDDITIDEILQKDRLDLAIVSSFVWDDAWFMKKIDPGRTRVFMIVHAPDRQMQLTIRQCAPPNVRCSFPPVGAWGTMHSKLQLLRFGDYIRVVIPTGNMVDFDWGETGVMENMAFIIDLPRLENRDDFVPTRFFVELGRFLRACLVDEGLVDSLANYDFSRTADLAFVHTIGGKHEGHDWENTGHPGLATAIQKLGLASTGPIDVELVASSIGSLNDAFLTSLYRSFQGYVGHKTQTQAKPIPTLEHMRIYFPTDETVANSTKGYRSGGTLCLPRKWWEGPNFPRQVMRDSVSTRQGLLLHTKMIMSRTAGRGENAWVYVGSSNVSESAWGKLVQNYKTGRVHLTCRNWECGVLIPMRAAAAMAGPNLSKGIRLGTGTTSSTTTATTIGAGTTTGAATGATTAGPSKDTAAKKPIEVITIDSDSEDDLDAPYGTATATANKNTLATSGGASASASASTKASSNASSGTSASVAASTNVNVNDNISTSANTGASTSTSFNAPLSDGSDVPTIFAAMPLPLRFPGARYAKFGPRSYPFFREEANQ